MHQKHNPRHDCVLEKHHSIMRAATIFCASSGQKKKTGSAATSQQCVVQARMAHLQHKLATAAAYTWFKNRLQQPLM
jgi:hypothetical protein